MAHATRVLREKHNLSSLDVRRSWRARTGVARISVVSALILMILGLCGTATAAKSTSTTVAKNDPPVVRQQAAATVPGATDVPVIAAGEDIDYEDNGPVITAPANLVVNANGWVCPVPNGKFTNDWGQARPGGRSHTGTDMLADAGTPILAPIAGVVSFKASSRGGNSFYLKGADGLQIFGAHLSKYGESGKVKPGTIIGYVGDSGNARGTPHLHFEIQHKGQGKTNPYPVLKSVC
jgi:peptidoglycan LD-endopeptidase LytH